MHPSRIFKSPDDLQKAWNEYKEDLKKQSEKWLKVQYVGKEGERVTDAQKVPMTMEGFEVFCYDNYGCVNQYFDNKDGYYDEFVTICSRIKKEIRQDQITGGMLGFYNPSITQRLNNLHEKVVSTNTNINHNSEDLSADDIKRISDELENDI
jgi:hypothetical protein